jgi:glycosyltransferase involved in cell wall biosynthesis
MSKNGRHIIVVLPALNEERAISFTIMEVRKTLPEALVVVVDNGSIDNTSVVAREMGAVVLLEPRRGKGLALRRGLSAVRQDTEYVLILDADDTYEVAPIHGALDMMELNGLDMVVGTRCVASSSNSERNSAYRRGHQVGNKLLTKVYQNLFDIRIEDTLSGWRLLSRGFVDTFPSNQKGFEVEAELNAHSFALQCGVGNIDVEYRGRHFDSHSKLLTYKDGLRILRASLRMFRNERPSLAFNLLSLPWVALGVALTTRSFIEFFETGLVARFPSLIVGMSFVLIGSLLWVTGMILERSKILRHSVFQLQYKNSQRRA